MLKIRSYYTVSATTKAVKERKSQILKQYGELRAVEAAKKMTL